MLNATLSNRNTASQRQMPSAHMLKTMELLACPVGELEAEVERELSENPALRLVEEMRCPPLRVPALVTGGIHARHWQPPQPGRLG